MAGIFTGSDLARDIYGQMSKETVSKTQPLLANQFLVRINYDPIIKLYIENVLRIDATDGMTSIKQVSLPSMSIDTETLNEYNRKRVIQTKVNYDPVTLVFHDTANGAAMNLWQLYYKYYFHDSAGLLDISANTFYSPPWSGLDLSMLAPDNLAGSYMKDGTNIVAGKSFGYANPYVRYVIRNIEIFQVHGGKYNKTTIINPRITDFNHDTLSYDNNDTVELTFKFDYEWVDYEYDLEKVGEEDLDDFFKKSNVIDYTAFNEPSDNPRYTGETSAVAANPQKQTPVQDVSAANTVPAGRSTTTNSLGNQVNVNSQAGGAPNVPPPTVTDFSVGKTDTSNAHVDFTRNAN